MSGYATRRDSRGRATTVHVSRVSQVDSRTDSWETARVFHDQTKQLVRCAYDLHELVDIHQRQRVVRILQIRIHIIRCSAGEALDVREIHDGFVKLPDRHRYQRNSPAIVIAGIAARRSGRRRVLTAPLNVMSYFSNGSIVRL